MPASAQDEGRAWGWVTCDVVVRNGFIGRFKSILMISFQNYPS